MSKNNLEATIRQLSEAFTEAICAAIISTPIHELAKLSQWKKPPVKAKPRKLDQAKQLRALPPHASRNLC